MKFKIIIIIFVSLSSFTQIFGNIFQPFGINFNYLKTSEETNITNLTNIPTCCPFKMSGNGDITSLGVSYYFHNTFGFDGFDLSLSINVNNFNSYIYYYETQQINVNGDPFEGKIRHSIDLTSYSFKPQLELKYTYSSIFLKYNLGFDLFFYNKFTQKEEIIFPNDRGVFDDTQTRTRNIINSKINDLSTPISNSLVIGFSLDYKSKFSINPGFIMGFRNSISTNFDWQNRYIGLSIDILFNN